MESPTGLGAAQSQENGGWGGLAENYEHGSWKEKAIRYVPVGR